MGVSFDTTSATVVVPIMAASLEDVALQWEAAVGAGADIVEWRIDALEPQLWDAETVGESGAALRAQFGKPVLATMRTAKEGGGFTGSAAQYRSILRDAGGWADLVDVEVGYRGAEELVAELRGEPRWSALSMTSQLSQAPPPRCNFWARCRTWGAASVRWRGWLRPRPTSPW